MACRWHRERSSMVEYQLPKLATGVRFPSLAPIFRRKIDAENMKLLLAMIAMITVAGCATAPHRLPTIDTGRVGAAKPRQEFKYPPASDSFVWPIRGHVISAFGSDVDRVRNKGIDIRADLGANVMASRAGRVVYSDSHLKGFGKTIILDHGDNYQTVYSYNSDILVNVGDPVRQNDVIARVGRTGRAKEPSLHFEIRKDGEPQNPAYYLPRY